MRAVKTIVALVLVFGSCVIYTLVRAEDPNTKTENAKLRVGTFDSRAVVIAYGNSAEFNQLVKKLKEQHNKAKAEGDEKKAKELEEKGKAGQQLFHMQGFSTASVSDILEHIKDQIPAIAKEAGVDLIVSKWDIVYQTPDAEFVDVTNLMVKPFNPSEKVLTWIKDLPKHRPISLEEARNIKD